VKPTPKMTMVGIFLIIVMLGLIACSSDEVDDAPLDEASIIKPAIKQAHYAA